ncbi:hypothetical protein EVC45_29995 [Paraburkholderia sp. UYCP14C]|uniref:hypothetical protein n=1 Tax=Paraburkholderia sp. UYCP14C TaxID=2511130 RepID=UPI0010225C1B|nr:hypothetical protein [Paraburkholderia sp. UYCP14C]RZF26085.1 hypothetical protein EVC45_29995 [Paraburkholderia sp. UYCP14C]
MTTTERMTTESQAREAGLTREVTASSWSQDLNLLIAPDTDFDTEFAAFDLDARETVSVKGWLGVFEDV